MAILELKMKFAMTIYNIRKYIVITKFIFSYKIAIKLILI